MTHCQPDDLGDGVHVRHDGYSVVLTTEGTSRPQIIYLEPEVLAKLVAWPQQAAMRWASVERCQRVGAAAVNAAPVLS